MTRALLETSPNLPPLSKRRSDFLSQQTTLRMSRPRWHYALLFLAFLSLALAACKPYLPSPPSIHSTQVDHTTAAPTSFCKCTCFTNSTIIPLNDPPTTSSKPKPRDPASTPKSHRRTCNDCNKQFCLDYHLPICQGAKDEDVFTTCFQRDSTKDELVVFIFVFATGGLLAWAAVRPWVQKWRERGGDGGAGGTYEPVGENGEGEGQGRQ